MPVQSTTGHGFSTLDVTRRVSTTMTKHLLSILLCLELYEEFVRVPVRKSS